MKIAYRALPASVQEQLKACTSGARSPKFVHVVRQGRAAGGAKVFAIPAAVALLILLIAWFVPAVSFFVALIFIAATAGAGWLAAQAYLQHRRAQSPIQPSIVATPLLIARTTYDHGDVDMHYLRDLTEVPRITHQQFAGNYSYTLFFMRFADGDLTFSVNNEQRAEAVAAYLRGTRDQLVAWQEKGQLEQAVERFDWIAAANADGPPTRTARPEASRAPMVGAIAGAVVGLLFVGINLWRAETRMWNEVCEVDDRYAYERYMREAPLGWHRDEAAVRADDAAFRRAVLTDRARALRKYVEDFPEGRNVAQADEKLHEIYGRAFERYKGSAKKAIPQASEGMQQLLTYLATQHRPEVGIAFLPGKGIDGGKIEQAIRTLTGSKRVHPVGPSFTLERNQSREKRIVELMQASFARVFSDDLFALRRAGVTEPIPRFLVRYAVLADDGSYVIQSESHLPSSERQHFVAIKLRFDLALQVPGSPHPPSRDPAKGYRFTTEAVPAPNFDTGSTKPRDVYDRMIATAFQKFEVELANAYGLELVMPASWGALSGTRRRTRTDPFAGDFDVQMPKIPALPSTAFPGTGPKPYELPDYLKDPKKLKDMQNLSEALDGLRAASLRTAVTDVFRAAEDEEPFPSASVLEARVRQKLRGNPASITTSSSQIQEAVAAELAKRKR